MKQIKRIMIVVLALVLAVSLSLTAFAATASQDGLELSVTTDKTSYSATEQVTVTVTVKNTNAFAVSNVTVESNVPDGYKAADGYSSTKNIATLGAGETATLTVVYVPQNSGQPSGPSYPTYPPYPWYSENTSNTSDAEETEEVVEIDQPTEGNTNVFEEVTVTAKRNVGFWVLTAVVSAGALIAVLAGKKRLKKTMSIMLCIAMVGTLATVLPVEVNAAVMPIEAGGIKNLSAETDVVINNISRQIKATVSWEDNIIEEPNQVTVIFETNGGSVIPAQSVVVGETVTQPQIPTKDDSIFGGWYSDPALSAVYDFRTPVLADFTLYAGWVSDGSSIIPDSDTVGGTASSVDVYSITDLEIDRFSNTATATISALENCAVVIRFIDEEIYFNENYPANKQYLYDGTLFGSHVVTAGTDMEPVVSVINGQLPQYFVAEAILIGSDGMPLCDPYTNIDNTYTHEQFEAKTVNDFVGENVLNFDDDVTDNFGVLADDVRMLTADYVEEWYDPDSELLIPDIIYYITNPSDVINVGDKIYISDPTADYLFKVASVTTDENGIVTVIPADAEDEQLGFGLEEFYTFLKVDMSPEEENEPQPAYLSMYNAINQPYYNNSYGIMGIRSIKGTGGLTVQIPVNLETDHFTIGFNSALDISASLEIEWDITWGGLYFKCNYENVQDVEISGKIGVKGGSENNEQLKEELKKLAEKKEIKLGKFKIPFSVTGFSAFTDVKFSLEWKIDADFSVEAHFKHTSGFKYNTKDGKQKIDKKEFTADAKFEGEIEIKFGPKPSIGIDFLNGVVSAELEAFIGGQFNGTASIPVMSGGTSRHACNLCIDGEIDGIAEVHAKLKYKILELKGTPFDWQIVKVEFKILEFYLSLINEPDSMFEGHPKLGWGSCPNKEYYVTVKAKNEQGNEIAVPVEVKNKKTDQIIINMQSGNGVYLAPGEYEATGLIDDMPCNKSFTVTDESETIIISKKDANAHIFGTVVDAQTRQPISSATITIVKGLIPVAIIHTTSSGAFSSTLQLGTYTVVVSADGYVTANQTITINEVEEKNIDLTLLAKDDSNQKMGGFFRTITDAVTGRPVSGVSVNVSQGLYNDGSNAPYVKSGSTDTYGSYDFRKWNISGVDFGLNAGNYTVTISKEGYITKSFNVVVVGGQDGEFNCPISPVGTENEYRIVLRWDEYPYDLDSHLNATYNGSKDHIYFEYMNGYGAYLDVDDTYSYGPETVTIPQLSVYDGNVYYSVHDYSNRYSSDSTELSNSRATVEVYLGSDLMEEYYIPAGIGGTVWNVFYITPEGKIVSINTFDYIENPSYVGN